MSSTLLAPTTLLLLDLPQEGSHFHALGIVKHHPTIPDDKKVRTTPLIALETLGAGTYTPVTSNWKGGQTTFPPLRIMGITREERTQLLRITGKALVESTITELPDEVSSTIVQFTSQTGTVYVPEEVYTLYCQLGGDLPFTPDKFRALLKPKRSSEAKFNMGFPSFSDEPQQEELFQRNHRDQTIAKPHKNVPQPPHGACPRKNYTPPPIEPQPSHAPTMEQRQKHTTNTEPELSKELKEAIQMFENLVEEAQKAPIYKKKPPTLFLVLSPKHLIEQALTAPSEHRDDNFNAKLRTQTRAFHKAADAIRKEIDATPDRKLPTSFKMYLKDPADLSLQPQRDLTQQMKAQPRPRKESGMRYR
ncbi:MAG: hypothetical protein H6922_02390 [Pseudomonadaceae bacterium]|nr:hypothetical protein [Pseudomonadaceae bacterium]